MQRIVEVDCEVPTQSWRIDRNENNVMVFQLLREDDKFIKFLATFERKPPPSDTLYRQWPYILNNGQIMRFPTVYFYFISYTYCEKTGKRSIRVGFICWVRGIYASIDIDFYVYPEKSVYVNPHKAWRLPYSCVTTRIQIFEGNNHITQNPTDYVRVFTEALLGVIRLCVEYNTKDIRLACYTHGVSTYPSYRLADLLMYQQRLVSKTRNYMLLHCGCSFKTIANIPYCGCETLCSETIPELFPDARRMNSDVLFRVTAE
jgi:hypothetical protein